MKKPTILRTLIFAVAMLFNFVSHSQNLIAFDSKFNKNLKEDVFFKAASQPDNSISLSDEKETSKTEAVAALTNPIIPYAQLPYAGQVVKCPNDGKELPKLFLCGGNDSRPININITDPQSIVWERFISGGGCVTVSNSDCANETAAASCWKQVGTGKDYLANTAGQFRVKIVDKAGVPSVFYFNVYQNTLIPTAVTKSDIIKSSDGNCKIDGKITVGGFGNGYEYSFTTTGAPGLWDVNSTFTTSTPGNYTAFIRIKDVVGSCEFKVINLDIKSLTFQVKTSFTSPKCNGDLGSVKVITNDIKQDYKYEIFKVTGTTSTLLNDSPFTKDSEYPFSDLAPGNYRVITSIGTGCMKETNNFTIAAPAAKITASATLTDGLTACSDKGIITVSQSGGTAPYQYFVSTDGGTTFVANGTSNKISLVKAGSYIIRVEDVNGCSALAPAVPVSDPQKPIYEIIATDGNCNGGLGQIEIRVSNANGYTMSYTFEGNSSGPIIKNLDPGNYLIGVNYSKTVRVNGKDVTTKCSDPVVSVAIGGKPALTASAGVAELAGCGPVGNEKQGKIRITNAEGGTAPYKYSFDLKKTWIDQNWAYIDPVVDHKVYVKDNVGCIFEMSGITLKPKPNEPTIKIDDPVFNCDGTATTTVTVTNDVNSEFIYSYFIDGTANTPINSNVFKNVSQGDHTIMVSYTVKTVPTYSNLLVETFGSGPDVTSPGINTFYYKWERQVAATQENGSIKLNDGEYTVTAKIVSPHGTWLSPEDHTTIAGPKDLRGRYLAVNIGDQIPTSAILYQKEIKDVIADQPISVKISAINLLRTGQLGANPNIQLALVDLAGNDVSSVATGAIPKTNKWEDYLLTLNPGKNTNLRFVVRSNVQEVDGNDVAIDDITVFQMPKICGATALFPIVVDGSKAFSAGITGYKDVRCSGEQNGEITLSAKNFDPKKGFQYLIAGDPAGWQTVKPVPAATSGSITLKNLASKIYNISIRYDDTAGSCSFPVAQEIKSPKKLKVDAWVEQVLKCSTGAIIKAKASDGTPGYRYELRETDGVTVVKAFQDSDTFLDIKITGNYKVVAKDLNDCETEVLASVDIVPPVRPKLENVTPSVCFDKNAGTNITIKVTDGVPDYTYTVKYNGGNPVGPSATFAGPTFTYKAENEGTYEFIVTDSFGCSSDPITQVITAQLLAATPVTTPLDCDVAPANRAVITGTIEGGKAPFTVTITTGDKTGDLVGPTSTGNTFTYTTAVAGNYTFTIKDANNCTTTSDAKIEALVPITLGSTNVNPKCDSSNDGTILLKPGGGTGVYTYSKDDITYNSTSYFTGLSAGVAYTYYVKDENRCKKSITVTLTAPDPISGTATITVPYTCDSPATITVGAVVTGGNGVYKYTLNRNGVALITQTTKVFDNISVAGDYTVTITDSNSCTFTTTPKLTIVDLNPAKGMTISTTTAATCPLKEGSVTITNVVDATNTPLPTAGLEYRIVSPTATAFQPSNVFDNIKAGVTYKFEVRDANKCTFEKTHLIDLPKDFTVTGTPTSIKCFGASDGSAIFTVSGMVVGTTYSYSVDTTPPTTGSGTSTTDPFNITVSGLDAGLHTIVVTNSVTKCKITEKVTVAGPASALKLNPSDLTHVTCKDLGTAKINAVGGSGAYTYTVTQKAPVIGTAITQTNDNLFKNLAAGTYSVSVSDGTGCNVAGTDFTINPEVKPIASIDATSVYCAGGAGATLIATPKNAPKPNPNYEYKLNSGNYQPSGTFSGLTPGKYTITVRDIVTGCTADLAEEVISSPLSAKAAIDTDLTCDPTSPEAIIGVTIQDGYPDYKYRVNTSGAPFSGLYTDVPAGQTKFTYPALAGTHYFEITDSKGCTVVVSQTVNSTVKPDFNTVESVVLCKGDKTGSITVNPILAGSYTYEVTPITPAGTKITQTTNVFENLGAGTYSVVIVDAKKCASDAKTVTIKEPLVALTADADVDVKLTCDASNNAQKATIKVTASGGTPYPAPDLYRYSYNGKTPVTSNTYSTTASGNVTVDVYDANGCKVSVTGGVTIDALNPPKAIAFAPPAAITCETGHDKTSLTLTVTDGVLPFTYEITSPTATVVTGVNSNSHTFTGLVPGHYYFKVTDANKCTVEDDFEILDVVKIQATGSIASNVTCNGLSNGSISFKVSGNRTTDYTYTLVGSVSGTINTAPGIVTGALEDVLTFAGLKGGQKFTFTVTNKDTKCSATSEVTLADPVLVEITKVTGTKVFCAPHVSTTIVVTAKGGKAPLKYAVVKAGVTPTATDFVDANTFIKDTSVDGLDYDVYVQDGNSCPAQTSISITRNDSPKIDPVTTALCYAGAAFDVKITGSVYSGSTTKLYGLNGVYNTNDTKSITAPGKYTLGIKDDNGCEDTTIITVNDQLKITVTPVKDLTCAVLPPYTTTDAQFTLSAEGGVGPYTYRVSRNGGGYTTTGITGSTFSTSQDGDYKFEATDSNTPACSIISGVVKVSPVEPPVILTAVQSQKILCPTESTGAIKVTLDTSKGASPFTYKVELLDAPFTDFGSQMTGLPAGHYKVTVTDSKGCFDDELVEIIKPKPIVVDYEIIGIKCDPAGGMAKGSIIIHSVTGGTVTSPGVPGSTGYSYYVTGTNYNKSELNTDGTTSVTFSIVDFGLYKIVVKDENGCSVEFPDELVTSPPNKLAITVTYPPTNCDTTAPGGGGGSAVVKVGSAFSGTGPFFFRIYDGTNATYPGPGWQAEEVDIVTGDRLKQTTFTNLTPGVTYTYVVYDDQSKCYYYETGAPAIPSNSTLTASNIVPQNVTCSDVTDGNVTFTVNSIYTTATNFTYTIFNGLTLTSTGVTGSGTVPAAVGGVPGTVTITSPSALDLGYYYVLIKETGATPNQGCSIATTNFKIDKSTKLLRINASVDLNATCSKLGTISASAQDGTAPYTYQAVASGTAYDPTKWNNKNSFNLAGSVGAGTSYDVYVKDANGCIKYTTIALPQDPIPAFTLDIVDNCAAEGSFEVEVTETTKGKEPYYISVNGKTFVPIGTLPYTIKNLSSGPVDVIIKDFNGCETPVVKSPITPTPKANAEVTTDLVCDASGAVGPNAIITVTITNGTGTPNFTYAVKKGTGTFGGDTPILPAGSRTFTYPVAATDADSYVFLIKDANGCEIQTTPVAVDPIVPIVPDATPTQPLCFGGEGTMLLSAKGGKGKYEYTLLRTLPAGGTLITQSTPLFINLIAGDYTYTVKDELGCVVTGTQTLGQPTELILDTPTIDQPLCGANNAPQQAKVVLAAHGGTGAYEYSFNNSDFSADTNIFYVDQNGASQTIPYAIRDENGCPKTGTVTILWLDPPTKFDLDQPDPITCLRTSTSVEIKNVTGGILPLTYQIVSNTGAIITENNNNPLFGGLLPGDYIFQVTDANKCIKQIKHTVKDVIKIEITPQSTTDITCLNAGDGKASFLVTRFNSSYDYELDSSGTTVTMTVGTIDLTGLAPGPHSIKVTDTETGCPATFNFDIYTVTKALGFTVDVTPLGCKTTGAVKLEASEGWGGYTYTVTEPAPASTVLPSNTDGVFAGLTKVGVYTVSVKDAKGCEVTKTFELKTPIEPVASIDAASVYCYTGSGVGQGATIIVNASTPGTPEYTPIYKYSIDNGKTWLTNNTFTDLAPGNYQITVIDQYGCQALASIPVEIKGQIFASAKIDTEIFCGPVDGTIKITAVGGYGSYTYTVKNPAGVVSAPIAFPAGLDTAYHTVLAGETGNYEIVVYDARNCSYVITEKVVMNPPTQVDLLITDIDITPVDCNAPQGTNNNGTITVNLRPVNNSDSYNYTLTPLPAGTAKTQGMNVFSGLAPGKYNVSVTSNLNCEANVDVEILDPVAVTAAADAVPFSCTVNPTKTTAVVTAGGGTGTYTFSIDGIRYFASNSIPADNKYTFELGDNGSVQDPTFYVKDSKGCLQTTKLTTVLNPLPKLNSVDGVFGTKMDCINNKQEINVTITGGSNSPNPFTYNVYKDGAFLDGPFPVTGNTFTYDAPTVGSYYEFEVFDNNTGCSLKSASYEIPVFDKAKVVASTFANVDCSGNASGSIEINILNYSGKYDYAVYKGATAVAGASGSHDTAVSNPFVIPSGLLEGNNYTVRIVETDFPSCPATSNSVIITEPDPLDLSGFKVSVKNQNCHDLKAVLTIDPTTIVGGTSGYMYAVVPTTTPPTIPAGGDYNPFTTIEIATSEVSPQFDSYDVYVRDAQNCFDHVTVKISQDPMPSITSAIPTQCPSTAGTYDIPVIATGFTPNLEYSLDGNSWGTNSILVVKTTGDHTVYVRDENKCVVTQVVHILEPLKLLYDDNIINPICNGNEGEVTLIASGGTIIPSYEYTKDNWANTQTTPVFSGLSPGKYTFSVRDTGTNCTKDVEVVFEIPNTAIDFSLTPSKVLCNGGSTGSITVNMAAQTTTVNNNPVYTYAIHPSPIGVVLVGNVFTNLPKGTYTVTVTSGKGCPVDKTIDVEEPLAITVPNPDVVEFGCTKVNKANDATITVGLPSGGSNDYKVYEFLKNGNPIPVQRGDNPVYIESDLLGGNYVINVYDTNGCLGTTTAVIKPFVAIDFATPSAITVTKAITCINDEDIQVNVTTTGTTTPMPVLLYNLKGISTGSTYDMTNNDGAFTGLTIGNYLVTVTNPITGCTITMIHYVNDPNTFDLVASNIKNVICYGTATGSVDLSFVDNQVNPDEAGPFEYTITGPKGTSPLQTTTGVMITIPNLEAGFYTVKAKLSATPSCEVETSFSIAEPTAALSISVNSTPISCDPGNDGTITVGAEGGWPGSYLYELVGVGPGAISVAYSQQFYFENLTPGSYTVNVKDLSGCVQTESLTLKTPDAILVTANATVSALLCNGDTSGVITVDLPTGGQGTNYSYILNYLSVVPVVSSAPQSQPVFSGLAAGTYSVTVVDGLNCVSQPSAELVISEPSKVEAELKLATGITCKTSATLTLSATGGTGQYEYSTDKTFAAIAGQFSSSVTFAVGLGDHQYYVRDSRGCVGAISNNITINPVTPLDLKLDLMNAVVYCKGDSTAVIDAEGVGGLGNYIYTLLDSTGGIVRPAQPSGYFDLLPKGVYVVRVDSGDCQYSSQAITINEPAEALSVTATVTDVTCFGADDGKIVIAATGGTGVIQYAISPNLGLFDTKSVFDRLVPGLYQIIIQDENSCFQIIEREIKEPTVLEAKVVGPIIQEICDGDKDGAFTIEISGGKPPYSISLDNENGTYAPVVGTQHSFANLKGGAHKVFVKDATCLTSRDVIMDKAVVLDPITEVSYHCVDNAQANMVVVKIDDSNDIADVDYSLDGTGTYQPSNVFTNVAPGTHFIVARHTNGCETPTTSFKIVSYEPLALTLAEDKGVWNIIKATATGGGGDYEYSIDGVNFSTKNEFKIYKTGTYTITVRDKNGCTVSQDYYIKYIDVCLDNYFTPNGDGVYDTWGPGCTNIYDKLEFSIFDRYGRIIAKYHYGQKWDGRYNGAELPSGDYWYVLKLNDENDAREFVGHFTLYR
ncbi:T9SS type B sorting domain-containing protein [Flavobacterium sp. FlaQc-30]|uniref:T9SS type B sorting domain-containing protein n=1 Tax=Flavobacterium sp. FlaQc-30 TaxID=3374179 RepID=UPI003756C468